MKSLKFNFVMNMLLTASNFLFPLITFPYISRVLQADGVGKITFFTSIVTYFALFAQLGIPTYGIRACAKVRHDKEKLTKTVQELFFINLAMSIVAYMALLIAYLFIGKLNEEGILFLVLSSTIAFNLIGMEWLYKSLEEYFYITVRSLVFKIIGILLMFLFVHNKSDYIIYGMITIFAGSASNLLNFINIRKHITFYNLGRNYDFKQHLKPILIFFALSCATIIYTNLDTVMLGFIHGDTAVGYYSTSVRIKSILLSIVTSLGAVLLPRLSYYIQNDQRQKFLELSNKSFKFILILAFSISIYFILYSKEAIFFLAGDAFQESILPMQLVLPTVIFIGITNLFGIQILVPLGKEKFVVYSVVAGAVINALLNWWLIPTYSYVGTAIANLAAELTVLFVQMYFIKDLLKEIIKGMNYLSMIVALIFASLVSFSSKLLIEGDFFILVLSSIMFFFVYYIVLRLFKNEFVMEIESTVLRKFGK